jgi:hypothetical protein
MGWPWHFVSLNDEQVLLRREILDRYGAYAQLSALIPVLVFQLYRLGVWVLAERERERVNQGYTALPQRPNSLIRKEEKLTSAGLLKSQQNFVLWWLGGDVHFGWGQRGHWIGGFLWASWLLFLCVRDTGDGMCTNLFICSCIQATNGFTT